MRRFFDAFRKPESRPRALIWTGVATFALAGFVLFAIGATSTNWFCATVCHEIQDDTIVGFNTSVHANLSCLECHMPVQADPVTFMIHKVEAGVVGMYQKLTKTYELPLNPESELALEMKDRQCRQCHKTENRLVDAKPGLVINHKAHMDEDIGCPVCHNRVAHPEPANGKFINPGMKAHDNFLTMTGCERCHGLQKDARATGKCEACHTEGFELKPASHLAADFYQSKGKPSKVHAELFLEDEKRVEEAEAEEAKKASETALKDGKVEAQEKSTTAEEHVNSYRTVKYCEQCHTQKFCDDCHGMEVPHTDGFKKSHGEIGRKDPKACQKCHEGGLPSKTAMTVALDQPSFCDACHHPGSDGKSPWVTQHDDVVKKDGSADDCKKCHDQNECEKCHVQQVMKMKK